MDTARIDIVIHGSSEDGYTLEDAELYTNFELRQLISRLPKAFKAVKKEQKQRRIEKRCRELEQKSKWTLRDTIFYAIHSKNIMTILYRKKRAFRDHGICGLVDLRGGHNKGSSIIPSVVWNTFLSFWLDQAQMPAAKCYEYTEWVIRDECPELLPLASYNTFVRHIKSDISLAIKTMGREGNKAFRDRCSPYIKRIYDNLESNDIWFGDNHTLDIESLDENGRLHRLHMSTFQDARSGIIVGFVLSDGNTGQTTLLSLRKSIMNFGCCKTVYLDNGREYMVTDIAGLGHRQKKSTADRKNPPTVLQRLNVGLINAIVGNAQAKNVERAFRNVKDNFSRLFDSFVGGNVLEKPERLKLVLKGKQGHILTDKEVGKALEEYIYNVFNLAPYQGRVKKDRGTINLLRYRYEKLSEVQYALDDMPENEYIDSLNYLYEEGYIQLRNIRSKKDTSLADSEIKDLEAKVTSKANRLLEINFQNARCRFDTNKNMYVDKKRSAGKVDMVVALINAVYLLEKFEIQGEAIDWAVMV